MRLLIIIAFAFIIGKTHPARAAEPFLRPGDIIALVGGEDMVVASELGYIETLLQRALPAHKLKFRSLAHEGDTVFEQPRDLNYPTLEAQLDKIGATVVICQFGQMESLAGKDKLPDFIAAYEKMIVRLSGGGKRRVAIIEPRRIEPFGAGLPLRLKAQAEASNAYTNAIRDNTASLHVDLVVEIPHRTKFGLDVPSTRDGLHTGVSGSRDFADSVAAGLLGIEKADHTIRVVYVGHKENAQLTALITAKNKLWYHYYRPQNWAFLAGDRTNQPSSRDHKDPSKRWFPEELETFIPLIEAKEQEIWALAGKLK